MSQQMPIMYGIANCDTIKKARHWMSQHNIDYKFHDYKKLGTDEDQLKSWIAEFGWEKIINKRGTSWRKLDDSIRNNMDDARALGVMQENPSIIKRPLLETGQSIILGFNEAEYIKVLLSV
jgi:arsenate reductase (glutaredoxin)